MSPNAPTSIDAERSAYRAYFDGGVSTLMSLMWGGNLHMGLFMSADDPLAQAQQRAKRHIARLLNLGRGQSLLEVACGVGTTAIFIAQSTGARVHATNISETQLQEARARVARAGLDDRVTFGFADYHAVDGVADAYDAWLCQEALLYARDRHQVLSEASRVVKSGGRLLFTDLTLSNAPSQQERQALMTDIKAPHLWSLEEYDVFVDASRLKIIERHDWGEHAVRTFAAVANTIRRRRNELAALIGEEAVQAAQFRIDRQHEFARAGHLGWCLFCLENS